MNGRKVTLFLLIKKNGIAMWTYIFCITFFPHCTKEWNQLNDDIEKVESIKKLKNKMLNLNHLNEHKLVI